MKGIKSMLFLAIVLPGIYFLITFNIIRGIVVILLMSTGIGWILASIWAVKFRIAKIHKGEFKETKKQMSDLTDTVRESKQDKGMVEPKFEIGSKLKSYVATHQKGFTGYWKIEGESSSGQKFTMTFNKGDQFLSVPTCGVSAKCLNWKDVTF